MLVNKLMILLLNLILLINLTTLYIQYTSQLLSQLSNNVENVFPIYILRKFAEIYTSLMTILASLASVAGVIMGMSSLPQIYKIFSRKKASDVSKTTHYIIVTGAIIWTLYGFEINSLPLIASNIIGVVTNTIILFGCYNYKN